MSDVSTMPKDVDFSSLDDVTLGAVALSLGTDDDGVWDEIERRANEGSAGLGRMIIFVAMNRWAEGLLPVADMLRIVEPHARSVATQDPLKQDIASSVFQNSSAAVIERRHGASEVRSPDGC